MATNLSDLNGQRPGVNLWIEGHDLLSLQSKKALEDPEELGSAPSHLPSWSLVKKLTPEWTEAR